MQVCVPGHTASCMPSLLSFHKRQPFTLSAYLHAESRILLSLLISLFARLLRLGCVCSTKKTTPKWKKWMTTPWSHTSKSSPSCAVESVTDHTGIFFLVIKSSRIKKCSSINGDKMHLGGLLLRATLQLVTSKNLKTQYKQLMIMDVTFKFLDSSPVL